MTISSTTRKAGPFTGNGTANTFPFAFKVFATTDVYVVKTATATGVASVLVMGTDYTVSLNADQDASPGGNVVLTAGNLPTGYTLLLTSAVPQLQQVDFTNQGGFYPAVLNKALDRLTILVQQQQGLLDRALITPISDTDAPGTVPAAAARAGRFLSFDAQGNPVASSGTGADAGLRTDLAAEAGAGLVGHSGALNYAPGTLGAAVSGLYLNVKMAPWLATGNGATDDTAAIQAAIDRATALGGGVVWLPAGTYKITSTLNVTASSVRILGAGCGGYHDATGGAVAATILNWQGAAGGTMLYVRPTGTSSLRNTDVAEIYLKGNGTASIGLRWVSSSYSIIRIGGHEFTGAFFQSECATTLSEAADVQNNDIWLDGRQQSAGSGSLAVFKGAAGGNFSFNRIHQLTGLYNNGAGAVLFNSDNNNFYSVQLNRIGTGTGVGIVLSANGNDACRSNNFWSCSPGAGGFYAQGTDSGGVYPSVYNNILFYDTENGPPTPVKGPGASLWWGGNHAPFGMRAMTLQTSPLGTISSKYYADGTVRYSGAVSVAGGGASATITYPTAFTSVHKASTTASAANAPSSIVANLATAAVVNYAAGTQTIWWEVEGVA